MRRTARRSRYGCRATSASSSGTDLPAPAQVQQGVGTLLDRGQPQIPQPRDVGLGAQGDGVELRQHLAAPHRQRRVEQIEPTPVVPGRHPVRGPGSPGPGTGSRPARRRIRRARSRARGSAAAGRRPATGARPAAGTRRRAGRRPHSAAGRRPRRHRPAGRSGPRRAGGGAAPRAGHAASGRRRRRARRRRWRPPAVPGSGTARRHPLCMSRRSHLQPVCKPTRRL